MSVPSLQWRAPATPASTALHHRRAAGGAPWTVKGRTVTGFTSRLGEDTVESKPELKLDAKFVEDLARKLAANVPGSVRALQADLERNFEALLASTFEKLQLVTRDEFDVQRRVLERTRVEAELEALEARLEKQA